MRHGLPEGLPFDQAERTGACFRSSDRCAIVGGMVLAGSFAAVLFLGLILADWMYFTRLTAPSSRYGCGVARLEDRFPLAPWTRLLDRFDCNGLLRLPHGLARVFPDEQRILLRPQYRLFSLRFRTAWPLKGSIEVEPDGETTRLTCVKRVPWSSALLTLLWFVLVGAGTAAFVIAFLANGGLDSLGGLLMGLGIAGLGLLVLAFGLVTVSFAYRLEDHRLTQTYQELRAALTPDRSFTA